MECILFWEDRLLNGGYFNFVEDRLLNEGICFWEDRLLNGRYLIL